MGTLGQDPEAIAAVQTAVFLPGQTKSGLFVLFFFGGTCIILSALAIIIWVKFELSSEKVRTAASTTAGTCRNACRNLPAHVPEFVTKRLPWEIGPPPSPSPPSETSSNETSDTVTPPSSFSLPNFGHFKQESKNTVHCAFMTQRCVLWGINQRTVFCGYLERRTILPYWCKNTSLK